MTHPKRNRTLPLVAALTLLLTLLSPVNPARAQESHARLQATTSGGLSALLVLERSPLISMTPIPFTLQIVDPSGTLIRGADVSCDLSMPAMAMPPNRPPVTEVAGDYRGEAIFTMAGDWRATFTLALPSDGVQTATFDLPGVRLK